MIVAISPHNTLFITERQRKGGYMMLSNDEAHSPDLWIKDNFLSYEDVMRYHRAFGDDILLDDDHLWDKKDDSNS